MVAGDELAEIALKLEPSRKPVAIKYLWGDNDKIKVLGAHMIKPNEFIFPPHHDEQFWYLKFSVSSGLKDCVKVPYITVHELKSNRLLVYLARVIATCIFFIPLILLVMRYMGHDFSDYLKLNLQFGSYAIGLPLTLLLLLVSWSTKVTDFIRRLFSLSTEYTEQYRRKGVANLAFEPMEILEFRGSEQIQINNLWSNWKEVF